MTPRQCWPQNNSPTQSGRGNNQIIPLSNKKPCVDHPVPNPLFLTHFNLPVPLVIQESHGPLHPVARATACPLIPFTSIEISPVAPLGHPAVSTWPAWWRGLRYSFLSLGNRMAFLLGLREVVLFSKIASGPHQNQPALSGWWSSVRGLLAMGTLGPHRVRGYLLPPS